MLLYDNERIFSFDHSVDTKVLTETFISIQPILQKHPWRYPENYTGWSRAGWSYSECDYRHNHTKGVFEVNNDFPITKYPYIVELCDEIKSQFDIVAPWFFHNLKTYIYNVHYDSARNFKTEKDGQLYDVPKRGVKPNSVPPYTKDDLLPGWTADHMEKKAKGSIASLNILLCKEWSNDDSPAPVMFTKNNQRYTHAWDEYFKSDDDWSYTYKAALLNTQWTHYVHMNGVNERLLFRFSIYDDLPFEEIKRRVKKLSFINNSFENNSLLFVLYSTENLSPLP